MPGPLMGGGEENTFSTYATTNSSCHDRKLMCGDQPRSKPVPSGFASNSLPQPQPRHLDDPLASHRRQLLGKQQKDPATFVGPHKIERAVERPGVGAQGALASMQLRQRMKVPAASNRSAAFVGQTDVISYHDGHAPHHHVADTYKPHQLVDLELPVGGYLPSPRERRRCASDGATRNRGRTALWTDDPEVGPAMSEARAATAQRAAEKPNTGWRRNTGGHGGHRQLGGQVFPPQEPTRPPPLRRLALRRLRWSQPVEHPDAGVKPCAPLVPQAVPVEALGKAAAARAGGDSCRKALAKCESGRQLATGYSTHGAPGVVMGAGEVLQPTRLDCRQQQRCISRKLENEGDLHMSMYQSHFVNQALLPEPGGRLRAQRTTGYGNLKQCPIGLGLASNGVISEQKASPALHPSVARKLAMIDPASLKTTI
eukprot:TRINITY_DN30449_c0_g1_i1.p1 TRINITY_DN30449_c0_g1~~TRINITY_DN30449_c0_g1_i1.p1  ORF type:complete len:451 (+),score=119.65 TRINITY_DN30449_c0_g1_i1:75-1355(+)